jgi:hypothetical protein
MGNEPDRLHWTGAGIVLFATGLAVMACTTESTLGPIGNASAPGAVDGAAATMATQQGQQTDIECPAVTIRTGASTHQIPAGASATNVRYQGSLGQLARECAILGDVMTMRVGVEGRLLVGPKGGPGTVNVPLRMALIAEGPQPKSIWQKFYNVPVTVPPGASQAIFSQVEDDLTFPLPPDKKIGNYIVYVGFDPQGAAAAAAKAAPKAAPKPKPKPTAPATATKPAQPAPTKPQPQFEPPPSPPPGVFAPPPGHS